MSGWPKGKLREEPEVYAAAMVHAIAREERWERRPKKRILEKGRASWERFRGRLGNRDLIELLLEDAAASQPLPFDAGAILPGELRLDSISEEAVTAWLDSVGALDLEASPADYIQQQARLLQIPTRMARSELPRVHPHHRVLELPGSGGQLAHHLIGQDESLHLPDVFTIACGGWREWALAGLVAVERGLSGHLPRIRIDPDLEASNDQPYDFVIGPTPENGGSFERGELEARFHGARIALV